VAILVTGAGGLVGQAAVAALAEQGVEHVRAILRHPGGGDLRRHGAKVAVMDATDPDAMEAALTGVFTAVSLTGSLWAGTDPEEAVLEPARVLVATSRRVGVRRLVVLSPARDSGAAGNPWLRAKAEVEELVAGSGLEYAILRCTHVVGPGSRLAERLRGPGPVAVPGSGRQRVAPVWVGDVARAIAVADDRPEALHATWTVAGPDSTTFDGFVDALNQATVAKRHLDGDSEAWRASGILAARRAGLSAVQADVLAADSLPDPATPPAPGVAPLPLAEAVARSRRA
jgi:NADH dehydrogenase